MKHPVNIGDSVRRDNAVDRARRKNLRKQLAGIVIVNRPVDDHMGYVNALRSEFAGHALGQRPERVLAAGEGGVAAGAAKAGGGSREQDAALTNCLTAGNLRDDWMDRLNAFWKQLEDAPGLSAVANLPGIGSMPHSWVTITSGIAGFFKPNLLAFPGSNLPLPAEAAGYYSTLPFGETLGELVDFSLINSGKTRLTVGAANVHTSAMRYFDSRETEISVKHIMASGALPPAFPAVRIDGELYWDGGILSNTPVEAVFDDNPLDAVLKTPSSWLTLVVYRSRRDVAGASDALDAACAGIDRD